MRLCRAQLARAVDDFRHSCWRLILTSVMMAIFPCCLFCQAASATNPPYITAGTASATGNPAYYTYNQMQVVMTADSTATEIRYTTDGSTPTITSTLYSSSTPVYVSNYSVIKAIANTSGVLSAVTTAYVQYEVPRSNLQLWLKPENLVNSGSSVTGWSDVSGYNLSVTQGTSANQPTFVQPALYGFNGASFNGATTNSSYLNVSWIVLSPPASPTPPPLPFLNALTTGTGVSLFAVVNPVSSAAAKTLFTSSSSGVTDLTALQTNGSNVIFNANNGATIGSVTTTSAPLTTGTFQILDVVYVTPSPAATIDVNAAQATNGTSTLKVLKDIARPVCYIGGNNALLSTAFWGGQLVELLCYGKQVTPSERAQVQAYLNQKYQFSTSLATAMPVISVPAGTLSGPTQVAIAATPNATIFFTQDGTTPVAGTSPQYSQPVNVYYSQTLKAIAVANNISSTASSASYVLDSTRWPAPNPADSTSLQINLQLPTTAIPQ